MMQKKRNIRLASILMVMIAITIATYFVTGSSKSGNFDKTLFAVENTLDITKVTFGDNEEVTLSIKNNRWVVNDKYEADPQRISVLFAILKQVSVRREAAKNQAAEVGKLFDEKGIKVSLYTSEGKLKTFNVAGEDSRSLTYMNKDNEINYLVEIPGYKSYLAGIFALDVNGWRNPLIFDLNWANLASVSVNYPEKRENNITIVFDNRNLVLEGSTKADSSKLGNYIDDISLLYVNDYLDKAEVSDSLIANLQAEINIKDIAGNNYTLGIYSKRSEKEYVVKIDSVDFGVIESALIKKVTKPKSYFNK